MPQRRILFLSRWYPSPPDNGARLRTWSHLRALAAAGHRITLLSFADAGHEVAASRDVSQCCERILTVPWRPFDPSSWRARAGYFSAVPRHLVDTFSPAMQAAVTREAPAHDAVVAFTLDMSSYAPGFSRRPALLEELELGSFAQRARVGSRGARLRATVTWAKLVRYVARTVPRFAACTVASTVEAALARSAAPGYGGFHVIPNAIDIAACAAVRAEPIENRILFAGSLTFAPNRQAMTWFTERVLPRVRRAVPGAELLITGAPPERPLPLAAGVRLAGWVEDIRGTIASAAVTIAPIRSGGGTRLKILEAMALGSPVVATSKAAEGLAVVHGEHLLIADDDEVFAAQVVRLLRDADLRCRLAAAARALVARDYDIAVIGPRFCALVETVAAQGPRRTQEHRA